eukprot:scaffold2915_cov17-Tisochrysis_lutea.AAC.5
MQSEPAQDVPFLSPYSTIPLLPLQPLTTPCDSGSAGEDWAAVESVTTASDTPALNPVGFYQSLEAALADMQASFAQLLRTEAGNSGGWLGMWGAELQGQEHSEESAEQHDSMQDATYHPLGFSSAAAAAGLATTAAACGGFSSPPSLSKPPPWRSPLRWESMTNSLEQGICC